MKGLQLVSEEAILFSGRFASQMKEIKSMQNNIAVEWKEFRSLTKIVSQQ
jgi:hypothetical protein